MYFTEYDKYIQIVRTLHRLDLISREDYYNALSEFPSATHVRNIIDGGD